MFDTTQMKPISRKEIKDGYYEIHEFIEYLRYLAMDHEGLAMNIEQVVSMYELGVRQGIHWDDVADEIDIY